VSCNLYESLLAIKLQKKLKDKLAIKVQRALLITYIWIYKPYFSFSLDCHIYINTLVHKCLCIIITFIFKGW